MRYLILTVALHAPAVVLAEYHKEETSVALPDVFWLSCANGLYKVDRVNEVFAKKKPVIETSRLCENLDKIYADVLNLRCLEGVPTEKYFNKWTGKFVEFTKSFECEILAEDQKPLFK